APEADERALDGVLAAAEQPPEMLQRELRRRLGTEIVRREGSGEGDYARRRKGGELKRREIAVPDPALVRGGNGGKIQTLADGRPTVTAAHGDGELDARILGHAHDGRQAFVVGRGEALPAIGRRRIDDHAVARGFESCDSARDCRRLGSEARW